MRPNVDEDFRPMFVESGVGVDETLLLLDGVEDSLKLHLVLGRGWRLMW